MKRCHCDAGPFAPTGPGPGSGEAMVTSVPSVRRYPPRNSRIVAE